jgi:hypothetical protein
MANGELQFFTVKTRQVPTNLPTNWQIEMRIDDADYSGWTASRIVPAVLQTALLGGRKKPKWPVEVDIDDAGSEIKRVRMRDDREDICKGGNLGERPDGMRVIPLSPTAFADESPPKWGFFFSIDEDCTEFKGTSLDVYVVIESAWREGDSVVLEFDGGNLVVGARR